MVDRSTPEPGVFRMFGRFLCWLGLHAWTPTMVRWSDDRIRLWAEECDRDGCGAIGFAVEKRKSK